MYLARNGVVIGGQYAAYGFCNAAHRLRVAASFNKLFLKSSFQRAAEFSGASRRIPPPEPALITNA